MADFFTRQQSFTDSGRFSRYNVAGARGALNSVFKSNIPKKQKALLTTSSDPKLRETQRATQAAFIDVTKMLGKGVDKAYNVVARDFMLDVFDNWPVKTGFSKSQFDLLFNARQSVLFTSFVNYADYSKYIQEKLPLAQMTRKQRQRRWVARQHGAKQTIGNGVNVMRKEIFLKTDKLGSDMAKAIADSGGIGG